MSLKLYISKAYDRVEQNFLEKIMVLMGFDQKLISMIILCAKTVSFSILVNRMPKGPIIPSRGLRQGDPLSLYFFLLCTRGLNSLLNTIDSKSVSGVKICRGAPHINHLLFAYDCVRFCKANTIENRKVQRLLEEYVMISGQKINRGKTLWFLAVMFWLILRMESWHYGELIMSSNMKSILVCPCGRKK